MRPSSTEVSEDETETESSCYPESEYETVVTGSARDLMIEELENKMQELNLSNRDLKDENKRLKHKIKQLEEDSRTQQANIARFKTESESANKENNEQEIQLITFKSRIDQLEAENRMLKSTIKIVKF